MSRRVALESQDRYVNRGSAKYHFTRDVAFSPDGSNWVYLAASKWDGYAWKRLHTLEYRVEG